MCLVVHENVFFVLFVVSPNDGFILKTNVIFLLFFYYSFFRLRNICGKQIQLLPEPLHFLGIKQKAKTMSTENNDLLLQNADQLCPVACFPATYRLSYFG